MGAAAEVCHKHGCLWCAVRVGQITHTCLHLKSQKHKILAFMHRNDGDKSMTSLSVCEKPWTMWDFVLRQKLWAVYGRTWVCFLFLFFLWFRTWKQDCVRTTPRTPRGTKYRRKKSHVCVLYQRNGGGSRSWPVGGGRACLRPPVWLNCPSGRPTPAASQKHHWQGKKTMTGGQIPVTTIRNKTEQKEATGSGDSKPQD